MAMRTVPEVDEYLAPAVAALRANGAYAGLPGFAARLATALRAALLALNDVPATDTMWLGTNRRPTLAKLADYCLRRLRDDANDELARWGLVALKCHSTGEDCGLALLAPRVADGPHAAVDAVSAAIWAHAYSDDVTDDQVRAVLAPADRAGLEHLARVESDGEVAQVARIALQMLDGGALSHPAGPLASRG